MCARFTVGNAAGIPARFQVVADQLELVPRYNVAPSQFVPAVVATETGRALHLQRFGLIPAWSPDGRVKFSTINARAEDIEQKQTYRRPFLRHRCLIPADGFYEWQAVGAKKQPMHIRRPDGELFAFAGIFDIWRDRESDATVESFSIVTTAANDLVRPVHNRMPVILRAADEAAWLDPTNTEIGVLKALLQPYPDAELEVYPVSPAVNRPVSDGPDLIQPWTAATLF